VLTSGPVKVSFFETVRYLPPRTLPAEWPVPSEAYDREAGAQAYRAMLERLEYIEELGFDWVSVSEHHYSPRILTPSPIVSAAFIAPHLKRATIALLGPIVPHSNPVRVAEELAMLDTMARGRLVVGLLRGTSNEALTYDLNPAEARDRTDEGMELILKAWTEPQPFGWQGRYFQYRTVSIWPRPLQQPHPPTYALGTSRESLDFAARHRLGCGVSYGPFEVMGKATRYYREQCARHGWEPAPEQILYRANMLLAETDGEAHDQLRARPGQAPFTMREAVRDAMLTLDSRNIAGAARAAVVSGALPTTFIGSPDTVVEQVRRCRDVVGAGVLDLSLHPPGSDELEPLMRALELFGKSVLPRIREI
jgi:alkanesulfonate monooxygenase SsuD/methylene tetrahydromethanopterin reductase-like flavin-dependent oxidoreductase (luciferase family)